MLYLSLFFILAGLLVFFYSAFRDAGSPLVSLGRNPAGERHENDEIIEKKTAPVDQGPLFGEESLEPEALYSDGEDHEGIHHEISRHLLSEDDQEEEKLVDDPEDISVEDYNSPDGSAGKTVIKGSSNPDESLSFVLFDDRSSVIDYRNGFGSIDPSLKEYKNIKRMGNGRFLLDREGINFYMENKQFRFDFYRINEMVSGNNYIAAFIKGSQAVKLFVVENETELIERVQLKFHEYNETHQ
jgi:hypothetical protein